MEDKKGLSGAAKIIITVVIGVIVIMVIMFVVGNLSGGSNPHEQFKKLHG